MSNSYTRVILVTGANTGIGFALVKLLAERGHTVYLGARDEAKGKEAQAALKKDHGLTVHFVQLDVTDHTSIDKARDLIEQKEGHLDVLVNNAAVANKEFHEPSRNDSTDHRHTFDTNFFGIIQSTSAFVPLILKAPIGHRAIVNVTSGAGSNAYAAAESRFMSPINQWSYSCNAYSASKAALNSYTIALAHELIKEKIRVNAICPGFVTSNLNNHAKGGKTTEEGANYILPWVLLGPEDDDKYCKYFSSGQPFPW
ncbi:short-chain dehydrogenase reductase sdr [Moniliophthora roreri MCA 2997]|uniref:Short-chain dehydrogenase reductase sdr n=1 Tax=Moniliophthora roreri (strain MCA 2997) TaxID=1381753 RepID=V2X0S9_MONRO|nr:short-chain dehydrogenase reductase sdr [Moniliophthora roreri MCA 2997]